MRVFRSLLIGLALLMGLGSVAQGQGQISYNACPTNGLVAVWRSIDWWKVQHDGPTHEPVYEVEFGNYAVKKLQDLEVIVPFYTAKALYYTVYTQAVSKILEDTSGNPFRITWFDLPGPRMVVLCNRIGSGYTVLEELYPVGGRIDFTDLGGSGESGSSGGSGGGSCQKFNIYVSWNSFGIYDIRVECAS